MFRTIGFFACFALVGTGCMSFSDQKALHATAQKDFGCPPSSGLIDTRTEAKPVNMGNSNRMSVQGCGHKAIYDWDRQQSVWVKEPGSDPADAEGDAKAKAAPEKAAAPREVSAYAVHGGGGGGATWQTPPTQA